MMDRRKFYKKVISEFSQVRAKRKLSFEDEIASNPTQEQQSSELTSLLDNNQPLTSIENMGDHVSSSRIFYKNHQSISKLEIHKNTDVPQIECLQNNNTDGHNTETPPTLEGIVDTVAEFQRTIDSNVIDSNVITNTMENLVAKDAASDPINIKQNTKQSKRPRLNKKTYCEFISDNEDPFFTDGSSSWSDTGNTSSDTSTHNKRPKKKIVKKTQKVSKELASKTDDIDIVGEKGKRTKRINYRKNRKDLKNRGQEYTRADGTIRSKREIKPNPCIGKKCGNGCQNVTEERRLSLFHHFWSLSSARQRDWIVNMSRRNSIKRKRSKDSGKRSFSYEYYINDNEDRRRVCQQFLLNTLDITQTYVHYTLTNSIEGSAKDDLRGKIIPANKTKETTRQSVINFIKKLPALPSHYCRKDTTKLYLPVEFRNQKNLYRIYKGEKTSEGIDYVSEKIFLNIFNTEFNIGFHIPKKDKCLKCIKFDAANTEESKAEKEDHLMEKKASKERYSFHREMSQKRTDLICTSFDLQKVLNTPHGESMLLYYSRKYAVYNLCFYENGSREGFCYIWGETEGKRGSNEIASIIQKYIDLVDARISVKHLILYSDSCPGQNKNRIILSAIHNALKNCENIVSIQMNYLLPGHTEMSVDSMHSVIKGAVKNTIVWAPSQWATVCQLARKEPKPYNVSYLDHTDFKGYGTFADKYFRGNLTGKISKIRVATFKKSKINQMSVKYSMRSDEEEEIIPIIMGGINSKVVDQLYKTPLPITKTKYNDLKKLCDDQVIPKLFQKEYINLPSVTGIDTLAETDIDDIM
ncbi:uncharacterized protein LOC126885114 isoform X1 [Diabrotica virgifera virgifera]|uniref:DUF7869 domain-containing protein n=1 Tax=Diabrotica virgifera virgifera TaxID=50390 RepID=A0ABM5KBD3_DIAVI|nr:uncharacterized protein LOC126885114 isoform X1 [Diabrotica virgifera virgifera]